MTVFVDKVWVKRMCTLALRNIPTTTEQNHTLKKVKILDIVVWNEILFVYIA